VPTTTTFGSLSCRKVTFYYVVTAFVIWMVYDAIRRKAPLYWVVVIVLFAPLGSIIYFVVVKLRDWNPSGVLARVPAGPTLDLLRQRLRSAGRLQPIRALVRRRVARRSGQQAGFAWFGT